MRRVSLHTPAELQAMDVLCGMGSEFFHLAEFTAPSTLLPFGTLVFGGFCFFVFQVSVWCLLVKQIVECKPLRGKYGADGALTA